MAELNNTIVKGNLRVTSQAEIQEVIENGTSLANKYLALSGGTLTGNLNFSNNTGIKGYDSTSTVRNVLCSTSNNYLYLGSSGWSGIQAWNSIFPGTTETYDLGLSDYQWNRIYGRYLGRENNYFYDIFSSSIHTHYVNALTNGITFYSDYWEYDIGEISHSSIGEEDVFGQYTDYFRIGTPRSYYYDQGGWTELRMSCYTDGEQDAGFDYIAIRTNGPSAHSVLYLPPLRDGDTETLAITSDIPSVLPAAYVTTPPSSNNNVGIKFVLLNSQTYPESSVTKRNGYIYMWY